MGKIREDAEACLSDVIFYGKQDLMEKQTKRVLLLEKRGRYLMAALCLHKEAYSQMYARLCMSTSYIENYPTTAIRHTTLSSMFSGKGNEYVVKAAKLYKQAENL